MGQPGVIPGAVLELVAARANKGLANGSNDSANKAEWWDTSGNTNHGTLTAIAYTAAEGWNASPPRLTLDASGYVAVADLGSCEDKTYTWEVWYSAAPASAAGVLIAEYANQTRGDVTADKQCVSLNAGSTGLATVVMRNSASGQLTITSAADLRDNAVHHVVLIADGANAHLYVDGTRVSGTYTLDYAPSLVEWTTIGARRYGATPSVGTYLPGSIYVARIYPTAFSAEQVAVNYAAGYGWSDPLPNYGSKFR